MSGFMMAVAMLHLTLTTGIWFPCVHDMAGQCGLPNDCAVSDHKTGWYWERCPKWPSPGWTPDQLSKDRRLVRGKVRVFPCVDVKTKHGCFMQFSPAPQHPLIRGD